MKTFFVASAILAVAAAIPHPQTPSEDQKADFVGKMQEISADAVDQAGVTIPSSEDIEPALLTVIQDSKIDGAPADGDGSPSVLLLASKCGLCDTEEEQVDCLKGKMNNGSSRPEGVQRPDGAAAPDASQSEELLASMTERQVATLQEIDAIDSCEDAIAFQPQKPDFEGAVPAATA